MRVGSFDPSQYVVRNFSISDLYVHHDFPLNTIQYRPGGCCLECRRVKSVTYRSNGLVQHVEYFKEEL